MAGQRAGSPSVSMAHEQVRLDRELRLSSDRAFGGVLALVLSVAGLWPLLRSGAVRWPFLTAGLVFLTAAAICPRLLAPLHRLAVRFAFAMNRVTAPVVMAVLFFGLFTPVALAARLFGFRAPGFRLGWRSQEAGYWLACPKDRDAGSMELPY